MSDEPAEDAADGGPDATDSSDASEPGGTGTAEPEFDPEAWAAELEAKREEKDEFLEEHPQSPTNAEQADGYATIDYFEPDPTYRVAAEVTVHEEPEPLELTVPNAPPVRYLRVATFAFEVDGTEQELHGYRQEGDDSNQLFVPFRDKTTGQATYDRGRYMELEPEPELVDGEVVTIDFNLAYTPFCAFSEAFACPLPPEENWLDVAIEAGERLP